jgi:hypothetical protein
MIAIYLEPGVDGHFCEHTGRRAERDWAELIEVVTEVTRAVKAEQAAGTKPTDPRMRELARQWRALIDHFTRGGQRWDSRAPAGDQLRDGQRRVDERVDRDECGERLEPRGFRQFA